MQCPLYNLLPLLYPVRANLSAPALLSLVSFNRFTASAPSRIVVPRSVDRSYLWAYVYKMPTIPSPFSSFLSFYSLPSLRTFARLQSSCIPANLWYHSLLALKWRSRLGSDDKVSKAQNRKCIEVAKIFDCKRSDWNIDLHKQGCQKVSKIVLVPVQFSKSVPSPYLLASLCISQI